MWRAGQLSARALSAPLAGTAPAATATTRALGSAAGLPPTWAATAERELRGKRTVESLVKDTPEGIPMKPIYTAADVRARGGVRLGMAWRG